MGGCREKIRRAPRARACARHGNPCAHLHRDGREKGTGCAALPPTGCSALPPRLLGTDRTFRESGRGGGGGGRVGAEAGRDGGREWAEGGRDGGRARRAGCCTGLERARSDERVQRRERERERERVRDRHRSAPLCPLDRLGEAPARARGRPCRRDCARAKPGR